MNQHTFARYLYEGHKRNVTDFRLAVREVDGVMQFYIHPLGRDGETVDFFAVGNHLIPASVKGVIGDFLTAIQADCEGFKNPQALAYCPKCQADLFRILLERPWYVAVNGGREPNTPNGPGEAWTTGVQTCPECGHQWDAEG